MILKRIKDCAYDPQENNFIFMHLCKTFKIRSIGIGKFCFMCVDTLN